MIRHISQLSSGGVAAKSTKIDLQKRGQKAIIRTMHTRGNKGGFITARQRMLEWDLAGRDITEPDVLRVMSEVPREEFVPQAHLSHAYADGPLPIGMGQPISQPYIVALMTQELRLNSDCEVLEVGTGSGYQTAVLCRLAKRVYTIERIGELSESARTILSELGIDNVEFYVGDGSCGWPRQKVFDRIIVTAGVPKVPQPLIEQLAEDGLLIAPVGGPAVQRLVVCQKKKRRTTERLICDVRFVKLLGEYAFDEAED